MGTTTRPGLAIDLQPNANPLIEEGMSDLIYKILRENEWQSALTDAAYGGSPDDERDGFIHFSTCSQLKGTLHKYFRGHADIHIAAFEAGAFKGGTLRWEASRGGALFPHYYGPLNINNAVNSWQVNIPKDGEIDLSFLSRQNT